MEKLNRRLMTMFSDPRSLYGFLIVSTIVGILMPLVTIILKTARHELAVDQIIYLDNIGPEKLALLHLHRLSMSLPEGFREFSWHHSDDPWNLGRFYIRYTLSNAFILAGLLIFRHRILNRLRPISDWLRQQSYVRVRWLVWGVMAMLIFTFQTRVSLGFWWSGIGGFVFSQMSATAQAEPPMWASTCRNLDPAVGAGLRASLFPENARFQMQRSTVHYTTPRIMLALYQDGVYRPINYDIVELPFVNETFGLSHKEMLRPREFMLITRDNLVRRRRGVRFALPTWLGYPNHSTYMPVDYRSHPPPAELVSISVWETVIAISPEIEIDIYAARLVLEFDEQGVK